jgi:acyl transferase domain-containing protein/NAD(P)-dependent dehydrogenase (short-subunit alcohol dehydrogenase family)
LRQHRLNGRPVLPGAATLELFRAAASESIGGQPVELSEVAFVSPVPIDEAEGPIEVTVTDRASELPRAAGERVPRGAAALWQGGEVRARASFASASTNAAAEAVPPPATGGEPVAPAELYRRLAAQGVEHGERFRVVRSIWRRPDRIVARLALSSDAETGAPWGLHPALVDGALQALAAAFDRYERPLVPAAIGRVRGLLRLGRDCQMLARPRGPLTPGAPCVFDVVLSDEGGTPQVVLEGVLLVPLPTAPTETAAELGLFSPRWVPAPLAPAVAASDAEVLILLPSADDPLAAALRPHTRLVRVWPGAAFAETERGFCVRPSDPADFERLLARLAERGVRPRHIVHAWTTASETAAGTLEPQLERGFFSLLALGRALIAQRASDKRQLLVVVPPAAPDAPPPPALAALTGLCRTIRREQPALLARLCILSDPDALAAELAGGDDLVRWRDGRRERRSFDRLPPPDGSAARLPIRAGGVYLVTGGAGGLGNLLATELAAQGPISLVLAGRRKPTKALVRRLRELRARGASCAYARIDVTSREDVTRLVGRIIDTFGRLDGVFHCAGVVRDAFLVRKTPAECHQVLAPKLRGALLVDEATAHLDLDCFVLFSSVSGAAGNVGQADYAFANAFLDELAAWRNERVARGVRHGRTLSVGWPLWQEGGMRIERAALERVRAETGLAPLDTRSAFAALCTALASGCDHVVVAKGDLDRFERMLAGAPAPASAAAPVAANSRPEDAAASPSDLVIRTQRFLRDCLAREARLDPAAIDPGAPLERFGINSLMVMSLDRQLCQHFGELSKTLFYEHRTLAEMADWFVREHRTSLLRLLGPEAAATSPTSPPPAVPVTPPAPVLAEAKAPARPAAAGDPPIAIIGLAGRFPMAPDLETFWTNLVAGRDCISEIPRQRWDAAGLFAPGRDQPGKSYSRWGGFLDGVADFDPLFFQISPREAELMPPEERLFLETAWHALENAGHTRRSLSGERVGVWVGVMYGEYPLLGSCDPARPRPGAPHASIANRVSWFMNFRGPSLAVDSMCSSSLAALFLACEALWRGHATCALAGGVNLSLHPTKYLQLCQGNFLSTDGRCRSFGKGGDGYVPGEGCAALLLKPLERALAEGDPIWGVVRAVGLDHGGRSSGYTVPSPLAQADLIGRTLRRAGLGPRDLGAVEAHGTGTELGDPIEVAGLGKAFEHDPPPAGSIALGSVKSTIGHLEAAAGVAGIARVLLQLREGTLAPSLHSAEPNPNLRLDRTPFFVPQRAQPWPADAPRRAAVSSFGAGGANAHAIVEAAPERPGVTGEPPAVPLFVLSARDPERLREYARRWLAFLERGALPDAAAVAWTLQSGREAHEERLAVAATGLGQLHGQLGAWLAGGSPTGVWCGRPARGGEMSSLFDSETLVGWARRGEWEKIARAWVAGADVDWSKLGWHTPPSRVALPGYPFARERCWIEPAPEAATSPAADPAADPAAPGPDERAGRPTERSLELVRPEWVAAPPARVQPELGGPWLVLADPEVAEALETRLAAAGQQVALATPGEGFAEPTPGRFTVRPGEAEDFERLAARLRATDQAPRRVIQALGLSAPAGLEPALARGVGTLHALLRALDPTTLRSLLVLVTDRADVPGALARVSCGLARSLEIAWPALAVRVVYLDRAAEAAGALDEPPQRGAPEVRYARGERFESRLAALAPGGGASPLRRGAVCLIIGGAGGLGRIVAQHLLAQHGARVALAGRSARPAAPIPEGAAYFSGDIADPAAARRLLAAVRERFGHLDAVFHCAGTSRAGLFTEASPAEVRAGLRAKIDGTLALEGATSAEPPLLCVLFSSTSARLGDFGQGDYACGNRFLDELASVRAAAGRAGRTVSIGWPLWREGGLHLTPAAEALYLGAAGLRHLETAEGLAALDTILATSEPNVLVVARGGDRPAATANAAQAKAPTAPLLAVLQELAGEILKLPPARIDPAESLGAFGFDSVTLARFARRIGERLGVELSPTVFFAHATLAALAAHLGPRVPSFLEAVPAPGGAPSADPDGPDDHDDDAIAVVGMSGIFPGAPDLDTFWRLLAADQSAITEIPASRWDLRTHFGEDLPAERRSNTKWGGFIDDVDAFDAPFFRISPREAEEMDPQHRRFLETSWRAIEDAGSAPSTLAGRRVGVFVGAQFKDYQQLLGAAGRQSAGTSTGNAHALLPNRLSYLLDLRGPSEAIDTACSSSLVAIVRAARSLRSGECELALAGGVSLMLDPGTFVGASRLGVLSPAGRCKTFDATADGYVRGEGVGVLVLKPLQRALADGDPVHGIIRGAATGHGGRASSLTAPSSAAQADLLLRAWEQAALDPASLTYLEAHGTGTALGDPVEVEGIHAALGELARRRGQTLPARFCGLGSVKTNIGHLEPAAGVAGVIKVLLAMRERVLPGNPNLERPNPLLPEDGPTYLVREAGPWTVPAGQPRRAGVSSFGFGGAYAHVLLEEATPRAPAEPAPHRRADRERDPHLFVLSARNTERLAAYARAHLAFLGAHAELPLLPYLYTLQTGRDAMPARLALWAQSREELLGKLEAWLGGAADPAAAAHPLAATWLAGDAVDWAAAWREPRPTRLAAPTYPFALTRYWVQAPAAAVPDPTPSLPRAENATVTEHILSACAQVTGLAATEIDLDTPVRELGFESIQMIELAHLLSARLGWEVRPDVFFELHPPTLGSLGRLLAARALAGAPRATPALTPARDLAGATTSAIAIIGMAGRFPGSPDLATFFSHLAKGRNLVGERPPARSAGWQAVPPLLRRGGFLEEVDTFDPMFFGISAREAERMDPQQRLFLMTVWAAVEDAGYRPSALARLRTGLYVGVAANDYQELLRDHAVEIDGYTATGIAHSILANRISYLLDWSGPSEPVDTACSSSLVAIHRGMGELQRGTCDVVVAGGVNLILSPRLSQSFHQAGMLSPDGRCATFDRGANGYVRGEGVAALVLKRLDRARQDGDHIYAVLRSSAENHGGRATSLTAPSGKAQTELLLTAWEAAGCDPATLDYIEAHGTGTALGDPVEVSALGRAFVEAAQRHGSPKAAPESCGLGSVKASIGHLETAAGVAGVVKVVLALQAGLLPPQPHFGEPNPLLALEGSPFYVVDRPRPWLARPGQPRRAGVSSFGFGGVNAHVLLEEAPAPAPVAPAAAPGGPFVVPLSARTPEALATRATDLAAHLAADSPDTASVTARLRTLIAARTGVEPERLDPSVDLAEYGIDEVVLAGALGELGSELDGRRLAEERSLAAIAALLAPELVAGPPLADLAFTLATGREEMEERLAIVCDSLAALRRALVDHLAGRAGPGLYHGRARRQKDRAAQPLAQGSVDELARAWVEGAGVDFAALHAGPRRRLPLPTYPFARERYWIAQEEPPCAEGERIPRQRGEPPQPEPAAPDAAASPSRREERMRLDGSEPFVRDHVVAGTKVLPGVVYLDLALRAAARAQGAPVRRLRGVTFARPLLCDGGPVDIRCRVERDGEALRWQVLSASDPGEPTPHAEGLALAEPTLPALPPLDLARIAARMPAAAEATSCYQGFAAKGMLYGPTLRAIRHLASGDGEALATLELDADAMLPDFLLQPGLADATLQTVMGTLDARDQSERWLPFGLSELRWHRPLERRGFAWARLRAADRALRRFDVVLTDARGGICVEIDGLVLRPLRPHAETPSGERVLYAEHWAEQPLGPPAGELGGPVLVLHDHSPLGTAALQALAARGLPPDALLVAPLAATPAELEPLLARAPRTILQVGSDPPAGPAVLRPLQSLAQAVLRSRPRTPVRAVLAFSATSAEARAAGGAAAGFCHTLRLENPLLAWQVVELEGPAGAALLPAELLVAQPDSLAVRWVGGRRLVPVLRPAALTGRTSLLRQGGSYLITGGAGGLGLLLADHLSNRWGARLVLTGRSAAAEVEPRLRRLRDRGAEVLYVPADLGQRAEVEELCRRARAAAGPLHGVIHAAGLHRDALILKQTMTRSEEVLRPKVAGTVLLDACLGDESLDFFALFASATALLGNTGQADYAFANRFLNEWARGREEARRAGRRQGRTVAVDWQLWEAGGMVTDAETRTWMWEKAGIRPLPGEVGLEAFEQALALDEPVVGVFYGDPVRIGSLLAPAAPKLEPRPAAPPPLASAPLPRPGAGAERDQLAVEAFLAGVLARVSKTPLAKIRADAPLEDYGLDSVMIVSITRALEPTFGELSKTLLFEHQTLAELAAHFLSAHGAKARQAAGLGPQTSPDPGPDPDPDPDPGPGPDPDPDPGPGPGPDPSPGPGATRSVPAAVATDDIAIVGLAGRYPDADSVDELWEHLLAGRDLIREVPIDRWDHTRFYDPQQRKRGKAYTRWGGFLRDVAAFDPLAFGIAPSEARFMDPQERLFLEICAETLADAGYARRALRGRRVGVFVGLMYSHYQLHAAEESLRGNVTSLGFSYASVANRVSYCFDLRGPSLALDTMCSSSLSALALACRSVRVGECEAALAGGVNVSVHPNKYIMLSEGMFASSDGRCRSFGEGGDGYVPGEGVGAVLVKRLDRALADGDTIYGVIKGIALNHGGKTNGYSVPNPHAQADVIAEAWREARLDPAQASYLEAHGTGTALGDPIEMAALGRVFAGGVASGRKVPIGSVKSNVGHLESAAGMVGLTKLLLQLRHDTLVPSLHAETPNPNIDFAKSPFRVQRELAPWPRTATPRIGALSSFGAGGSNAHLVVSEHLDPAPRPATVFPVLLVVSGRDPERLRAYAERLLAFFERHPQVDLGDAAYTLQVGRDPLAERLALVAADREAVLGGLRAYLADEPAPGLLTGSARANDGLASLLAGDEDLAEVASRWLERGRLAPLGRLWVQGGEIDWARLPQSQGRRRIPLPPPPLVRERYWFRPTPEGEVHRHVPLHPLIDGLDPRRSLGRELTLHKRFRPDERIVDHHRVGGRPIVPGVALVEMALAAAAQPLDPEPFALEKIVWLSPLVVDGEPRDTAIVLTQTGPGVLGVEITTGEGAGRTVHARAVARTRPTAERPAALDLASLRARLTEHLEPAELYRRFRAIGIEHGEELQTVREVWIGAGEVLGRLEAKTPLWQSPATYRLHPALADGALQLIAALAPAPGTDLAAGPTVPFAAMEVACFAPLGGEVFAHLRAIGSGSFNLTLTDASGTICVTLREVGIRQMKAAQGSKPRPAAPSLPAGFLLRPVWIPAG